MSAKLYKKRLCSSRQSTDSCFGGVGPAPVGDPFGLDSAWSPSLIAFGIRRRQGNARRLGSAGSWIWMLPCRLQLILFISIFKFLIGLEKRNDHRRVGRRCITRRDVSWAAGQINSLSLPPIPSATSKKEKERM
jgi:hypothetical protein